MKTEILKLLRESKDYVSGQQLCETFGVSRTAVWKVMNQLKEEGYEVEAVRWISDRGQCRRYDTRGVRKPFGWPDKVGRTACCLF